MGIELRHLRYFIAVAEELHFGRAARRLNMTQPPLSQQIQELEKELGVPLLKRTNRRVELLYTGKVFLEQARRVLTEMEEAIHRTHRAHRCEMGWLEIGFCELASYHLLPSLLRTFRNRYPQIEIILHEIDSDEQLIQLRHQRIDLAFVQGNVQQPGITSKVLLRDPLMAVLPCDHELACKKSLSLQDLQKETLLLFPRKNQPDWYDAIIKFWHQAKLTPKISEISSNISTLIGMVSAGMGISLMPASIQKLRYEGVRLLPIEGKVPEQILSVAYRKEDLSSLIQVFMEVVDDYLKHQQKI
jgi:DNA-binding transcriptional LysR family regulator